MKWGKQEIKQLRKRLKMTQGELALSLGVDIKTITRWETGERRPSQLALRELTRLAKKAGR